MKKKVVFVILSLYGGGAERVVSVLSNALVEDGVSVALVLYGRKEVEYPIDPRVQIEVLDSQEGKNPVAKHLGYIHEIRTVLEKIQPDVVIPFLAGPVFHTYYATRGKKYQVFATVRNNPKQYPSQKWLRLLANHCTRKMDGIIFQTEEQVNFFPSAKKTFVLHNPVNPDMLEASYQYNDTVKCIATFGRLSQQKNHRLLISAFYELAEKYPEITLKIYGDGEERENLQNMIEEKKLVNRVQLMENTKDVKGKMQETDIFVLSSDFEGLPNALIEAMAMGIPCVSTACPTGPRDLIVNGKNGLLVPCGDTKAMRDAIEQMILDENFRERCGRKGKEKIKCGYHTDCATKMIEQKILGLQC